MFTSQNKNKIKQVGVCKTCDKPMWYDWDECIRCQIERRRGEQKKAEK